MNGTQVGVDLAKAVCEVSVSHAPGRVQERRRLTRASLRTLYRIMADHLRDRASAGGSAIWSETGELLVQLGAVGVGIAVATESHGGWRAKTLIPSAARPSAPPPE